MAEQNDKLIELVSEQYKNLDKNFNSKFEKISDKLEGINSRLHEINSVRSDVNEVKDWKGRIDEVVSPTQLKELKDEVYKQKNKWTATTAILIFIQLLFGVYIKMNDGAKVPEKGYNKEVVIPKQDYNKIKNNYVFKK